MSIHVMVKGLFSMGFYGLLKFHTIRGYRMSSLRKYPEPILIEYCEVNYVPGGVKFLFVSINIIIRRHKIGVLAHIYTYTCYVNALTG